MLKIAVLVSGGGTNLQALIDSEKRGEIPNGELSLVLASKPGVFAIERAKNADIKTVVVERKSFDNSVSFDNMILNKLKENKIDLVVLAGFMSVLGKVILSEYKNKIINVHPSLIPSFCGDGFYGIKVHKAALDYGVKITGATVHFVNEVTDGGRIILQKAVEIKEGDTPEILQKRVMTEAEWAILPKAVSLICKGLVDSNGNIKK